MNIIKIKSVNISALERWLGRDNVESIARSMQGWYGQPIAVSGVPGQVWAAKDGDFIGRLSCGGFASALDIFDSRRKLIELRIRRALRRAAGKQLSQLNAGFTSLSDLIAEATNNKRQELLFNKAGATGVVGVTNSLWRSGTAPPSASAPPSAPAGEAPTASTLGALLFVNPNTGDTLHFIAGYVSASVGANTLLLYDRIYHVNKTMNSTAPENVTGVPTRYQSTTPTADDYIGGNFLIVEVGTTALANTAHNWTVVYTNQANVSGRTITITGSAGAIVRRLDQPAGQWFAPLQDGDIGVRNITQMTCSAAITGEVHFAIGRAIAFMPCPVANMVCITDGINTAFNLVRIFNDACLAFLEITKPSTTATTYTGTVTLVSG